MSSHQLREMEEKAYALVRYVFQYLFGLGGRISDTNAKVDGLSFRHGAQLSNLSMRLRIIEAQLNIEPSLDWAPQTPTPTATVTPSPTVTATPDDVPTPTPEGGT